MSTGRPSAADSTRTLYCRASSRFAETTWIPWASENMGAALADTPLVPAMKATTPMMRATRSTRRFMPLDVPRGSSPDLHVAPQLAMTDGSLETSNDQLVQEFIR